MVLIGWGGGGREGGGETWAKMEVQSECVEPPPPPPSVPPCDPQPPGKINKAALKLFGKRRSKANGNGNSENGNSVNGNSVGAANELIRSKTHDGLTSSETDGQRGEESGISEAGQVRSLSKSLSFFSLLRRGSVRANENTGFGSRGRGLKGFFSSIRWRRKERVMEGEVGVTEGREVREGDVILKEEVKDVTLTLEPQPRSPQEDNGSLEADFDSLTGCGDIIADAEEEVAGNQPSGSGVVAYMGGGEEMASPDGVDDADMQGLWHMLPSGGENSPALPRPSSHPAPPRGTERKPPQVKSLGLSKIPLVGGGRMSKLPTHAARQTSLPNEKDTKEEVQPQQDVPALRDEGYWDTPSATPTATPDDGFLRNQRIGLSRDSCSGDALAPSQTTPPSSSSSSSFRSMKGSTSLPRESKIPLSVRQNTPPHSVSQSALSTVLTATPPSDTPTQAPPPARTRIPVSKVPVRRPGNKPGNATRGPAPRK
uniref:APC membrane recruitment protein 2 n=1 Tax=Oncorhynchus mykiss TaxID=8022 RepID=A0A8K9US06_ONCMY